MRSYASAVMAGGTSTEQVIDINHPYYLSSSDHPGIALVTDVSIDHNYHHWSRAISIALSAKLKLGFIDGTTARPASTSPQLALWKRSNDLVISWILNSVSSDIRKSIVYMNTAQQIWEDLSNRYSQNNVPRLFNLRKELASLTQGTKSITAYFTVFRSLIDELENLAPIPRCSCQSNTCACGLSDKLNKYEQQIHLSQFLMGLNDQFTATRGHILLITPLPDVTQAYAMLLQDENQRNNANVTSFGDITAMNARFNNVNSGNKNKFTGKREERKVNDSSVMCDYCHLSGHGRDKCFALHGYPDWHRLYGQPKPKVKGKTAMNVSTQATGNHETTPKSSAPAIMPTSTDQLTESQCQQLISMLQSKMQPSTYAPWISGSANQVSGMQFRTNSVIFATTVTVDSAHDMWILDSGATHHITPYIDLVHNPSPINSQLHLPNGECSKVTHIGNIHLTPDITLSNVLVVPKFHCNLLSIPQLTSNNSVTVLFSATKCILQDPALMMEKEIGELLDGLYKLNPQTLKSKTFYLASKSYNCSQMSTMQQWHWRLGHPSIKVLKHIKSLAIPTSSTIPDCEICHFAKQVRLPFPNRESTSSAIFDIVQCDVWGPYKHMTHGTCNKFLTIVDDFSKCTWLFLCSSKSQIPVLLKDFVAYVSNQFQKTIKVLRSDNGTKFTNHDLAQFCSNHGILQQFTCAHTPQQNGTVERKHQHLLNVARSLRFQANLPITFWGDCVLTATHLINMLPTPILQYKSPFEILYNKLPDYSTLRSFGCLCYISDLYSPHDKFAPKTLKSVFLGYPFNKKGYRVMDLATKKCYVTRDVRFVENIFPFQNISSTISGQLYDMSSPFPSTPFHELFNSDHTPIVLSDSSNHETPTSPLEQSSEATNTEPVITNNIPERPVRTRKIPAKFQDYTGLPTSINPSTSHAVLPPGNPFASTCTYSIHNHLSYHAFSSSYTKFLCATAAIPIPFTYKQAAQDANWLQAMKLEIHALESNNTWELVPRPPNQHIVDCKWLFKVKYLPDGSVERYKARLVAKGFTQTYGLDYFETFAPVAKMTTVRLLVAVAASQNWPITQLDVTNAFLHGDLHEDVYMRVPPGYFQLSSIPDMNNITDLSAWVCKLVKSIYGLRQAPRCWFSKFYHTLLKFGFTQCHSDNSLFTFNQESQFVAVLVYVDDILITGTSKELIQTVIQFLAQAFKVKDLGSLRYFLGIEAARSLTGIYMHQRKYTLDILQDTGLMGSRPSKIPMEQNHNLHLNDSSFLSDSDTFLFRRLVGRLIYLTVTRPDLSYAVQVLSQFISKPRVDHLTAAYKVVRYLKQSPGQGLFFAANATPSLDAFCDSDWGGCHQTRHSLTGYCVMFGSTIISWKSKKQHTVSRSSAEAEYRCMADTCCELKWLLQFDTDLDVLTIICNKSKYMEPLNLRRETKLKL